MSTELIGGQRIERRGAHELCELIVAGIRAGLPQRFLACANPHSLEVARRDEAFAGALRDADFLVPDGIGVVVASRVLGGRIRCRVTGSDIFAGVCQRLEAWGAGRCFFLGSTEGTLASLAARFSREFPNTALCGRFSPPFAPAFSEEDNERMVAAVNASGANVLWVGMTAPKQETWVAANRERLSVQFVGAVGAVFDFYAGTVRRPHPWFRDRGLEWLPRLLAEPRRLWRRNLVSNPAFLLRTLGTRLGRVRGGAR